jgi:ABC transporter substrate binding protein (PQQ-dependent alcohol dehydrogenase system)
MGYRIAFGALLVLVCFRLTASEPLTVSIAYLTRTEDPPAPLSLLDTEPAENGVKGAQLALADNNTTGRFLGQNFEMSVMSVAEDGDLASAMSELLAAGRRLVLADLDRADLLRIADLPDAADALVFNVRARDDGLRNGECRANVVHTAPSRAMLTDALAQYLAFKRWREWFLVVGRNAEDRAYADAVRRSAKRFGAKIVAEKEWIFDPGARRTDTGHVTAQQEIPVLTQGEDYDVLVVADEVDRFGEYLSYQSSMPRPVVGTQGLISTAWHRSTEQWGGTQMQNRFERKAGRWMTPRDYAAWLAVRSIGEAATRTGSNDVVTLAAYIRGEKFGVAAFKGVAVSYRPWNGQLRQPLLITGPRMLVSVSPQRGFLHEFTPLDTLGYDRPESGCRLAR